MKTKVKDKLSVSVSCTSICELLCSTLSICSHDIADEL
jgi:hypothetical protein